MKVSSTPDQKQFLGGPRVLGDISDHLEEERISSFEGPPHQQFESRSLAHLLRCKLCAGQVDSWSQGG